MAKASVPPVMAWCPPATRVPSVRQVTAASVVAAGVADGPPWGVLATMDQAVPFQTSARVAAVAPVPVVPTALHVVMLKQSTPVSACATDAEVLGTPDAPVHCVPFQVSIRLVVGVVALTPTAWHHEAPTQETDERRLPVLRPGVTPVSARDQAEPFHCSAKGTPVAAVVASVVPTATQAVGLEHDMPFAWPSEPAVTPVGVAAVVSDSAVPFHCTP